MAKIKTKSALHGIFQPMEGNTMKTVQKSARSNVQALVPKSGCAAITDLEIVDQIDNEILIADGIGFAVLGVGSINNFDTSEISALIDVHVDRLRAIRDQLAQEGAANNDIRGRS